MLGSRCKPGYHESMWRLRKMQTIGVRRPEMNDLSKRFEVREKA